MIIEIDSTWYPWLHMLASECQVDLDDPDFWVLALATMLMEAINACTDMLDAPTLSAVLDAMAWADALQAQYTDGEVFN